MLPLHCVQAWGWELGVMGSAQAPRWYLHAQQLASPGLGLGEARSRKALPRRPAVTRLHAEMPTRNMLLLCPLGPGCCCLPPQPCTAGRAGHEPGDVLSKKVAFVLVIKPCRKVQETSREVHRDAESSCSAACTALGPAARPALDGLQRHETTVGLLTPWGQNHHRLVQPPGLPVQHTGGGP